MDRTGAGCSPARWRWCRNLAHRVGVRRGSTRRPAGASPSSRPSPGSSGRRWSALPSCTSGARRQRDPRGRPPAQIPACAANALGSCLGCGRRISRRERDAWRGRVGAIGSRGGSSASNRGGCAGWGAGGPATRALPPACGRGAAAAVGAVRPSGCLWPPMGVKPSVPAGLGPLLAYSRSAGTAAVRESGIGAGSRSRDAPLEF